MERDDLVAQMCGASTPNDISTAINAARDWLAEHPQDDDLRGALQELMRAEREQLMFGR